MLAVDLVGVPLACGPVFAEDGELDRVLVVAVSVVDGVVVLVVTVLPFVPVADVAATVCACAVVASASAEIRESAVKVVRMGTSSGIRRILGSIGPHAQWLPASMGRTASVVVLGRPLVEAYAGLIAIG